ncbi:La protein, RNA-binding domain,Winged helix-turn-helix DNA-binding domain,La-type HTH domain,Lupus La [Cinara cedri]|uniref:La protein, RNA-binding domain,Winged helix-turn-helix DNA-binding domain,La-type HTH domain,Lupus La n=1 Tax=Cinara cedri TaxID=506608 RepID=A0A5E4MLR3_9HEMI|nr:La protein, RNA-binding domain,Winged helix-turn-helix DNA-binding domain,La-type HTH domain,Lupus La [Cinara cedri]
MESNIKSNNGTIETEINITTENEIVEPTVITETIDEKIVKQLEYYFSDVNFPYDKFLRNLATADNGWVEINVLMSFKRLASISGDKAVITSAVKTSYNSLLEIDETNEKIRRKPDQGVPVANQEFLNKMIEKSVYCNGFPTTATLDELIAFAATFGNETIIRVIPRKNNYHKFKGSAYFVFRTKELAHNFLKQKSVKYNDLELERMWEKDFNELKKNECVQMKQSRKFLQTEGCFKPGCLLKVDIVEENVQINDIKIFCHQMKWPVSFVKLNDDNKTAWIRMRQNEATAHDLLELMTEENKSSKMLFSIPKEDEEQQVLDEMSNELSFINERKKKIKKFKKTKHFKINKTEMSIF